ncbi:unnamed protein product [Rhizophagus irregularis]|nr:unnamed protein product [Rhizophagus irregularis]CAB4401946.1 unnamed protein product [Rhizophagus irregularis]
MDDLKLATKLGDIHLAIILYLGRRKEQYNNELQNNFIKELLENTQVSKLSISTQMMRPDLDNHFAIPSNCDDIIVAAPIHNELIEPNHFAAQTVTYDQPLPKMEKHQTDENPFRPVITPQTNQFMEGIETLPSINEELINRSPVNLDTETLIDISINPSNHDNTTSSSYMDSMWLLNQDIEMAENESMDVPLCNTTNYNRPDNHVTDHDTNDIVLAIDKCNINTSNYDKLIKDDDFFRPKHSFLPDIIKQNNDLLQLTNNAHQDGQDIK